MDRRFLTVLGVSLLFALVISSIFYQMTSRANGSKKDEKTNLRDIVIAAKPMGVGNTVKPADLKLGKVSASSFPKTAFSKMEEVVDRPVISSILVDDPILDGRLGARGSGQGLGPMIPVGMRAVAVRVNDVIGVSGFVLPGMRVDVLVTGRPPESNATVTTTCLQNIHVLSAGTTMQADSRGQAIQAPTVTLLVSPEQAETLTLANNEGHIQLVLRNGSDQTIEKTPGRQLDELYGRRVARQSKTPDVSSAPQATARRKQVAVPLPPRPPDNPISPPPDQIIVIRGTQKTIETIGRITDSLKPAEGGAKLK